MAFEEQGVTSGLNFQWLLVEELRIFSAEEYGELIKVCAISYQINKTTNKINVHFHWWRTPIIENIVRVFDFNHNDVEMSCDSVYLLTNNDFYELNKHYLALKGIDIEKVCDAGNINFHCPQMTIFVDDSSKIDLINEAIPYMKEIMEYVISSSNLIIQIKNNSQDKNEYIKYKCVLFHVEEANFFSNQGLNIYITNYKDYFALSLDRKHPLFKRKDELKVGKWYSFSFSVNDNKKQHKLDGILNDFDSCEIPENFSRSDHQSNKICCLSSHTKFSVFDGLFNFGDFAKRAKEFGHQAIGITDFSSVQGYAEVEKSCKKHNIKPLYGCEFEIMPEKLEVVINLDKYKPISKYNVFCIFDIETTGLYPTSGDVIEISIRKFHKGLNSSNYHAYIKTDKTLSQDIIDLTRITDKLLEEKGRDLLCVLHEVKEFIKDSILVAHNGIAFDLPFLNAQYLKHNLPIIENPLLDTMYLSRGLYGGHNFKSHSLKAIAKRFNNPVDDAKIHSAEYDTDLLSNIWRHMASDLLDQKMDLSSSSQIISINDFFDQKYLKKNKFGHHILVYAKNQEGIKDIYKLISISHTENFSEKPFLYWKDIEQNRKNLIITPSSINSGLFSLVVNYDREQFVDLAKKFDYVTIPTPKHFLHEINRGFLSKEEVIKIISCFYQWAKEASTKIILSYCAKYLDVWNVEQFKVVVYAKNIGGKRHPLYSNKYSNSIIPDYSFRNSEEVLNEFEFLKLSPGELLTVTTGNQEELIDQISTGIKIINNKLHPPIVPGADIKIKEIVKERIHSKYGTNPHPYILDKVNYEIDQIFKHKYEVFYWVAHVLVKKSLEDGYLVGSRGSVGSSFLAHLLSISEVNPLKPHYYCSRCSFFEIQENFFESGFDLEERICPNCNILLEQDGQNIPFETFMGLNGDKIPDIDLNFSGKYQLTVHNFLRDWFGKKHTFRSGTINTVATKTSFALAQHYLDDHCYKYNFGKITWLYRQVIDIKRTTGQHPGGILIIPKEYEVYDFTPINYPANDVTSEWLTTHLEFCDLHNALFKFDILGHDDPTFLSLLHKFTGIDPTTIKYNDPKILKMFSSISPLGIVPADVMNETTGTIGLPEFGTTLTRKILKDCLPKTFADLIRISGISHGTNVWKKNIDKLIKEKKYPLSGVISCRDDIMIYLVSVGFEFVDAFRVSESVRKGNGIPPDDLILLKEKKVPQWYIESANKITYIFPKSHATAYVLMSWKIAYYKLYHPLEFYATYFTINSDFFDLELLAQNDKKLIEQKYIEIKESLSKNKKATNNNKSKFLLMIYEVSIEMLSRKIIFKSIDINKSESETFLPNKEEKSILIPFISIDGLGKVVSKDIVENRKQFGDFKGRKDIEIRTKLNVTVLKKMEKLKIIPGKNESTQLTIDSIMF